MIKLLKKILDRKNKKYIYKLSAEIPTFIKGNQIFCKLKESGYFEPMSLLVSKVLDDPHFNQEINPRELLYLQKKLTHFEIEMNKIRVVAEHRNNEYSIAFNELEIQKISGNDLCNNIEILSNMRIKDAFCIIYKAA